MDAELWGTIRRLFEVEKLSKSAIAKRLHVHRQTVRRALASPQGPPADERRVAAKPGKVDAHEGYLRRRLQEYPELSAAKLLIEVRRLGYEGGYTILKEFLRTLRPDKPKAFLRLETQPGEFAQVDWANVGTIRIGNATRKLSCFVMVLSYSRMMYAELTLSQCLEDFLAAHVNAFRFFGGVTKKINYDNLKTVVLSRWGREIHFNPKFMDFAGCYLFEPVPCAVRAGWEKGKVESGIKYVRSAFLAGRALIDLPALRKDLAAWLEGAANVRIHGTTRERPLDRFAIEKPLLQGLPAADYDCAIVCSARASRQALVQFQTNGYSVPHGHADKTLTLKATGQTVLIYAGAQLLATHPRSYEKYRVIENPDHYAGLLATRKKARAAKRVEEFLALGPACAEYLKGLAAAELNVPAHLDKILECARDYGRAETLAAVARALQFGAFGAAYIRNIILQRRAALGQSAPRPVVLRKKPQWADVAVEETDLGLYDELFADDEKPQGDAAS
ncbi:MAG: IS21 family transposase [Elusimicrobia bacterium]|nr:IS21 family transposase [Elusimicrobiota bacterium]